MTISPGLLKLELFCRGIRVDPSCDLACDARPVLRTRGGLGSGLEAILPAGLYVNIPVEEHFAKNSPFTLLKNNGKYFVRKDRDIICEVKLPHKPRFYDYVTSSGKIMSRIGVMQGTYLAVYPTRVCEFWQMQPRMNCRFCSVGINVGRNEESEKSVKDVLETVKAAREEEKITFVHFNTGYLLGNELSILEPYIKAVKENTGLLVGVQCPPCQDRTKYRHLKKIGVDHLSFCIEVGDPERFKEVCPGKYKYIGQESYWDAARYCVELFGKGKVSGEIIAGLEDAEDTVRAIEKFAKLGAVSTVCIFRPCLGTNLETASPPSAAEMVPIFKRMYEVCVENGIPVGIAPNIRVSLVLLPEEGRYFLAELTLRFLFSELKLSILKAGFRTYLKTKILLKCG